MTTLAVIGVVIALGVLAYGVMIVFARRSTPLDTEREERWFVIHAPAPLRRVLHYVDRRVVGGAALAFLFMIVRVAATAVGWIFDTIDENQGFARFDQRAAEFGADNSTEESTRALEAITQLGATGWLLIVMAIVGVIEAWHFRKPAVLAYLGSVGLGVSLINNGLKQLVERERPAVLQLTSHSSFSFPSGHTAAAAACWAAIALVVARRWRRGPRRLAAVTALVITLAVAASRVLLGVHWLTDVIAGAITGWSWFMLVTLVFGGRILRLGEPAERIAESEVAPDPADRRELEVRQ
jgi:membrane-associated phospholipid phosphatase